MYVNSNQTSGHCFRLRPIEFLNVRERNKGKYLLTSFDVRVNSGRGLEEGPYYDGFHVELQSYKQPDDDSLQMTLESYDRTTSYGRYRACRDEFVDRKLCVCDLPSKKYGQGFIGM